MKKFLGFLIILLLCGLLVFLISWAELAIPRGSLAVARTKTGGVYPELLGNGGLTLIWERLLPTNTEIIPFKVRSVQNSFAYKGSLPSAELYQNIAGSKEAFSWELAGTFSFRIYPEHLIQLVRNTQAESQEELETWTAQLSDSIKDSLARWFSRGSLNELWASEGIKEGLPELQSLLERDLRNDYPFLESLDVRLDIARYPDIALYRSAASLYGVWVANQQAVIEEALLETSRTGVYSRFTLEELERYGALFERYPSLITFILAREAGTDGIKELLSRIRSE